MTPLSQLLSRRPARLGGLLVGGLVLFGGLPGNPIASFVGGTAAHAAVGTPSCWKVTVTPDDEARHASRDEFVEYLTFDSLGYTGEGLAILGFAPTPFTTSPTNDNAFTATMTSDAHGEVAWAGTVAGNRISGTMTWSRDGHVYQYTFTGNAYSPGSD